VAAARGHPVLVVVLAGQAVVSGFVVTVAMAVPAVPAVLAVPVVRVRGVTAGLLMA